VLKITCYLQRDAILFLEALIIIIIIAMRLEEYKKILPLAQKIVAMNIDISELSALDTAVNELAHFHRLPLSVAAFRLFSDLRDYNKKVHLKEELSALYLKKFRN
jgi:hypothetical protein